jgi:hypothetical protein
VSDDTDVRQRAPILDPRKRRGLGFPVHAELPRDLYAGRHLWPDAVLEAVERLPNVASYSDPGRPWYSMGSLSMYAPDNRCPCIDRLQSCGCSENHLRSIEISADPAWRRACMLVIRSDLKRFTAKVSPPSCGRTVSYSPPAGRLSSGKETK